MRTLFTAEVARKAFDRLSTKVMGLPLWCIDQTRSTYCPESDVPQGPLRHFIGRPAQDEVDRGKILQLSDLFLQHRFDIYGSGWQHSRAPETTEPTGPGLTHVQYLRSQMDATYYPLDWQTDLKSGYRWNSRTWFQHVRKSGIPGDIRRPWELARCHHWHVLSRAYGFTGDPKFAREIQNQFYDFNAANPPRFGIHWSSPMDVAIRASNWLMAVDLLMSFGASLPEKFQRDFKRSIWEHNQHLFDHLEASPSDRANHYLSNICGLIFMNSYLPTTDQSKRRLEFALKELKSELQRQFLPDGGSFEGSTSYHRLSTEMTLFSLALVQAASPELTPFDAETVTKLSMITRFTQGIQKPDGTVPLIGDDDSGRFLKLDPHLFTARSEALPRENTGDHGHILTAADALFSRRDSPSEAPGFDGEVLRRLLRGHRIEHSESKAPTQATNPQSFADFNRSFANAKVENRCAFQIPFDSGISLDGLRTDQWPDFGLYVIKSASFYLSIRCDHRHHVSMEGHAHNDVFALDLQIDGANLLRDPGSFTYYPDPQTRNRYRSIASHFPSCLLGSLANEHFSNMLFTFPNRLAGTCTLFSTKGFVGHCTNGKSKFHLAVELQPDHLLVRAVSTQPIPDNVRAVPDIRFSPGYGRMSQDPSYARTLIVESAASL